MTSSSHAAQELARPGADRRGGRSTPADLRCPTRRRGSSRTFARPSGVSPGVKRRAAVRASRFSVVVKGKKIKRASYAPVDATACES